MLLSWSTGKDCAWALHTLRRNGIGVVGLLTTFNEAFGRVAMHSTRREVAQEQARAAGLPLRPVMLPWPCSNEEYDRRMAAVVAQAREEGVTHVAFGDLFLPEARAYRESRLKGTGIDPLFPVWTPKEKTERLARGMLAAGLRAHITCVDPRRLDPSFAGREYDAALLDALPPGVDPCGENGEFHTVCWAGPMFSRALALEPGPVVERDGFWFADFSPAGLPGA